MKNVFVLLLVGVLFYACKQQQQQHKSVHYYLTEEQKAFINTPKAGDTCIWESSLGYRDTAIVQPVNVFEYTITSPSADTDGEFGEKAYYLYSFIGNKKTKSSDGIQVSANNNSPTLMNSSCILSWNTPPLRTLAATGFLNLKIIGSKKYESVYYCSFRESATQPLDTVFWNRSGFLGYNMTNEKIFKIK